MSEKIAQYIDGSKIDMSKELDKIAWNRRLSKNIEDYGCITCEYYGSHCIDSAGNEGFKCPLEDTKSEIYLDWVIHNYADLCDVIESPSLKQWENTVGDKRGFSRLYSTRKLMCLVVMPKTQILERFLEEYGKGTKGNEVVCEFSILQLHRRIREMLLYNPVGETASNLIARQLIQLLIPAKYQDMFTFEGNKDD